MVELALEIPIALLKDVYPMTDIGFSLAHMVLKYEKYRTFYEGKPQIMDNGMYELDEPMSVEDLKKAARMVMPTAIIAPDWMDESTKTSEGSILMRNLFRGTSYTVVGLNGEPDKTIKPSIAAVVQGKDLFQRMDFFMWCVGSGFSPICFPFRNREQRRSLIGALASEGALRDDAWYHLLGLNNRTELELIGRLPGRWSVDTAKPCKPGIDLTRMRWSGHGKLDHLRGYTPTEVEFAKANVRYLRSFL
jgi:hypothetical protein